MSTWVFLRGLMRETRHWGDFPARFREAVPGARVVLLDLPGNGRLHRQTSPTCVNDMTEHCRRALEADDMPPPYHLLAISLGGMVAVDWSSRHPEEIARCVLINTSMRALGPLHWRLRPGNYPALLAMALRPRDAAKQEAVILRLTSNRPVPGVTRDAWTRYASEHPVRRRNALRQLYAAARYRLPARKPPMPVLLLASATDRLVDARCSARLAAQWQLPLAVHGDAGHDLPLDDPGWVATQVQGWLLRQRRFGHE